MTVNELIEKLKVMAENGYGEMPAGILQENGDVEHITDVQAGAETAGEDETFVNEDDFEEDEDGDEPAVDVVVVYAF